MQVLTLLGEGEGNTVRRARRECRVGLPESTDLVHAVKLGTRNPGGPARREGGQRVWKAKSQRSRVKWTGSRTRQY